MGGKFEECDVMTVGGRRTGKWTFDDDMWCYDDQLDYSTDWRRLMPVWYKFKELEGAIPEIHMQRYYAFLDGISDAILNQGCAIACGLLAEGIRWYNANKQL